MESLIIFLSSITLLGIAVVWMTRPILKAVGAVAQSHAQIYAQAYVKASCLILIAMGTTFKETWEPITAAQAAGFSWWDWVIKFEAPLLSGLAVLSAFLDQSMQRAKETKAAQDNKISSTATTPPFPPASQ